MAGGERLSFVQTRLIVVTDLDGTLLDRSDRSFTAAKPALNRLRLLQIPWVLNSNKTLAELAVLRNKLVNPYPLILENGTGIALPKGFEDAFFKQPDEEYQDQGEFLLKPMGMPRPELLSLLEPAYKDFRFTGFDRMSPHDLCEMIDVDTEYAEKALDRHFNEPILWRDSEEAFIAFKEWASGVGLYVSKSYKFVHVSGNADKGESMDWLMGCFSDGDSRPLVVALGDNETDLPMLNSADIAVVVRSPRHEPVAAQGKERTIVTDAIGPAGWNTAVLDLLDIYGS